MNSPQFVILGINCFVAWEPFGTTYRAAKQKNKNVDPFPILNYREVLNFSSTCVCGIISIANIVYVAELE